jgi:peptidoglycan/xylan/chitin deacetylase (PgdA/CDA1 family)
MRCHTLEYHDIVDGSDFEASGFGGASAASYKLGRATFAAHLDAIAARGARVGRVDAVGGGEARGAAPVLLTFDDGGAGALSAAAPSLERHGWPGHFFVTTGRIGTAGFLDAAGIRALDAAGHVIGSHSCTHPIRFAALSRAEMLREWRESVAALGETLGRPVDVASVPGGYFSAAVAETAAEAGIRLLFTSEPVSRVGEIAGCRIFGRYTLRRASSPAEAAALAAGRPAARARQWLGWNAKKVAKRLGGRAYLALRERIFERGA